MTKKIKCIRGTSKSQPLIDLAYVTKVLGEEMTSQEKSIELNYYPPMSRPWSEHIGGRPRMSINTLSCWDCEHVRIGRMFHRNCVEHPELHIWSDVETEIAECGRTVASECLEFQLATEIIANNEKVE